ncbi:hypothetical protein B4U78_016800, partial [Microbacterium esteraromaticum]
SSLERQLERQLERHKTQYRYYLNRLMRGGQMIELGNVCNIKTGLSISEKDILKENVDNNLYPFIKIGDLNNFGINITKLGYIKPRYINNFNDFTVKPGDIMIGRVGSAGKLAFNNLSYFLFFSENIYKITTNKSFVVQKYLFYSLAVKQQKIIKTKTLGPISILTLTQIKKLKISLPSLEKQEKIAN